MSGGPGEDKIKTRGGPPRNGAMLEITELAKVYPGGLRALHGVSLAVEEPVVVTIIGSSGAGKSTLIRCVNRLVEPTSGRVVLNAD